MTPPADRLGPVRIRRALLSVSDKTGVVDFARALASQGAQLISTGGTARLLRSNGLDVTEISDVTGFPEMLGGRVKTLHPKVHGGILGVEADPEHKAKMDEHAIEPIDLVCVNLYPFEAAPEDASEHELIELIDIGGPAMVRSAAKNHDRVTIVTDPAQYTSVLEEMRTTEGAVSRLTRRELAILAFRATSEYDSCIADRLTDDLLVPSGDAEGGWTSQELRYGENPHQSAHITSGPYNPSNLALTRATQLHGKQPSYNNYNDASAAIALAWELHRMDRERAHTVVVKHTNPCGCASADDGRASIEGALAGDPLAAFGGILATNAEIDENAAQPLCTTGVFLEVIVAPSFTYAALKMLRAKSKNVRLLAIGDYPDVAPAMRTRRTLVGGDVLFQDADLVPIGTGDWAHAAGPVPDATTLRQAGAVWAMGKYLSSNAIAIGGADPDRPGVVRLFGAGAGQMDRVASCRIAVEKAGALAHGGIAASDAFFPFPDGPGVLIDAGVRCLVHPGGSKRDGDTFALCDERGVTCMTTGVRHFRH